MAFDDLADALHLATLLLQYGYIFPVIEHSLFVKDDNTLYRLQLPYFWPSHATQADNVEYGTVSFISDAKHASLLGPGCGNPGREELLEYF